MKKSLQYFGKLWRSTARIGEKWGFLLKNFKMIFR